MQRVSHRANRQEDLAQARHDRAAPPYRALEAEMKPVETPEEGKRASHRSVEIYRKALAEGKTREAASEAVLAAQGGETEPEVAQSPAEQNETVATKVDETKQEPEIKEISDEQSTHTRSPFKQKAFPLSPTLVIWLIVAIGVAAWFYHSHEIDRRASEATEAAAAARENQARSIVARVRNSWNADDTWEDTFSFKGAAHTPYTIELENALIKGRPILAFGSVEDVRKSGEQDNSIMGSQAIDLSGGMIPDQPPVATQGGIDLSAGMIPDPKTPDISAGLVPNNPPAPVNPHAIVLIKDIVRTTRIDLRFSLLSAPGITKALLSDENRQSDTFVIAATITSVEKVSMPPDESGNDRDYFLAHGILNEAQPIGRRFQVRSAKNLE